MNRRSVDVVVLGGGPAGCICARQLSSQGRKVALLSKPHQQRFSVGETLPPAATQLLGKLGLWDSFIELGPRPAYGILSAWGSPELAVKDFIYQPYGSGWHLDRSRFDEMLMEEAIRSGAEVLLDGTVADCRPAPTGWVLTFSTGGERLEVESAFIIDATGRHPISRFSFPRRIQHDFLVGVARLHYSNPAAEFRDFTVVEAAEHGWFYMALLPTSLCIVVYMTDADLYAIGRRQDHMLLDSLLRKTSHIRRVVGDPVGDSFVVSAVTAIRECVAKSGWAAVGDAAMSVDPLSSQGLINAIHSAVAVSNALTQGGQQEMHLTAYSELVVGAFANYMKSRQAVYGLERRWENSPFWSRRH